MEVGEGDGGVVGDAEAVVRVGSEGGGGSGIVGAAAIVVEGLVVGFGGGVFVRRVGGEGEVAAGAGAGVGEAGGEELLEGGEVEGEAVGLAEFGVPGEAEPEEIFAHGGGELGAGALGVEVFVAEIEGAVGGAGALVGDEEGAGVAEVEKACGGWSEAAGVEGAHGDESSIQQEGGRRAGRMAVGKAPQLLLGQSWRFCDDVDGAAGTDSDDCGGG